MKFIPEVKNPEIVIMGAGKNYNFHELQDWPCYVNFPQEILNRFFAGFKLLVLYTGENM